MFTGIIEEIGKIEKIIKSGHSCGIEIMANKILDDIQLGDSIAINGICLTVTKFNFKKFSADVMNETWNRTNLMGLKIGDYVNLERALSVSARLGGHIVSGHIDGVGKIKSITKDNNAVWFQIAAPKSLLLQIVEKGSITIDGISLTVANVSNHDFSVSVIPHTYSNTILKYKKNNDVVNLETDIIAKYLYKFVENKNQITKKFLSENGYI